MADLRPAVRSTNISLVNAGSMASGPSRPVSSSSESGENGAGPTAHVVEFDAPPVIEREGVTRVPLWLVVRPQYDEPAGHAHV